MESVRFNFNIESLGLVLFRSGNKPQVSVRVQHLELHGFLKVLTGPGEVRVEDFFIN